MKTRYMSAGSFGTETMAAEQRTHIMASVPYSRANPLFDKRPYQAAHIRYIICIHPSINHITSFRSSQPDLQNPKAPRHADTYHTVGIFQNPDLSHKEDPPHKDTRTKLHDIAGLIHGHEDAHVHLHAPSPAHGSPPPCICACGPLLLVSLA